MKASLLTLAGLLLFVGTAFSQVWNPYPEQATVVSSPEPVFPDEAKNYIYGDTIRVGMDVDKMGKVISARAYGPLAPCSNLKDPAAEEIAKAAVGAAKQAVFEPVLKGGKPVEATLYMDYRLRPVQRPLSDEEHRTVISGVMNGITISEPTPEYPAAARAKGLKGKVEVAILVGEDGHVLSAGVFFGEQVFSDAAVNAGCAARFSPLLLSGKPAKRSGRIIYNFVP